jgi:glucose dehydrogenase
VPRNYEIWTTVIHRRRFGVIFVCSVRAPRKNRQRYSLLSQITPANGAGLELKCAYQSRSLDKHEVTPIVVDGVIYTIQSPNDVVALDKATGATLWTYRRKPAEGTRNQTCAGNQHLYFNK